MIKMIKRILFSTVLLFSIPLALRAEEKFIASDAGVGGGHGPSWICQDLKIFQKHGLNVDLVFVTGATRGTQALLGGSTDFYLGDAISPVPAILRGGDMVMIGAFENFAPGGLLARKEIRNPLELQGKRIGIAGFGGSNELSVVLALKKWNLPSDSVTFLQSGSSADRLSALFSGALDAAPLPPPLSFAAAKRGMNVLVDFADIPAVPQGAIAVRRSFLEKNRDKVKRFMEAYSEAVYRFMTDKPTAIEIYRKWLRQSDPKLLDETYDYFRRRFSLPPRISRGEGMQLALQMIARKVSPAKKEPSVDQIIDESVTDEMEREGFFKRFVVNTENK